MNSKRIWIILALSLALVLSLAIALTVSAVGGAAFTTFNAHVDGAGKDVCKNSAINCNIYGAKEYVWLNGGPDANHLKPDGWYFFTVLEPGGQPNPNDQGGVLDKNLSDDYDAYTNRAFRTEGGEVVEYKGTHWLDDGKSGPKPNNKPPYIRLFPYSDTTNPGGVYIMSICFLGYKADGSDWGYPVEPRDCKYDAFKVKKGKIEYSFYLSGMKFEDLYADGEKDNGDPGLEGWKIIIQGTGPNGLPFYAEVFTDGNGFWEWYSPVYTFTGSQKPQDVTVKVCEQLKPGWTQSFPPTADGCHTFTFTPTGFDSFFDLDFGNWYPVDVTACKVRDLDGVIDGETEPVAGWPVALTVAGVIVDEQETGADGCYTWTGLTPGVVYDVHEGDRPGWKHLGPTDVDFDRAKSRDRFSHTFVNAVLEGCTPGFWKTHSSYGPAPFDSWPADYEPDDLVSSVFPSAANAPYTNLGSSTLLQALNFQGGNTLVEKAEILLRAAVAAVLNAAHPEVYYPYTVGEIQALVNAALDSGDAGAILALATKLDEANNAFYRDEPPDRCPLPLP